MSQAKYYSMSFEQGAYNTAHGKVIEPIIDIDLLEREDREPEQTIVFGNGEQSPSKSEAVTQAKKPSQDPSLPKEKER